MHFLLAFVMNFGDDNFIDRLLADDNGRSIPVPWSLLHQRITARRLWL